MPTFRITSPDGSVYNVTAPDGATQDEVLARVQAQHAAAPDPKKKPDPGLMSKLSDAITFRDYREEVGKETARGKAQAEQGVADFGKDAKTGHVIGNTAKILGGESAQVFAPITAAMTEGPGRMASDLSGGRIDKHTAGDVASFAIPVAGELAEGRALAKGAQEAGVGVNTLRKTLEASKAPPEGAAAVKAVPAKTAAPEAAKAPANVTRAMTTASVNPERDALVTKLKNEGVDLTRGQANGGRDKAVEEALKSNPFTREGTLEAQRQSFQSLNRAAYNRALNPVGLKYDPKGPVGYEGIKRVGQTLGKAFDEIVPKLKLVQDEHLATDLHDIKTDVSELPKAQQEQYETIMKNRFFAPLVKHGGVMSGQDFKDMEEGLSDAAATWKSSGDPAHRQLGKALDASLGALRDNLERSSDPSVRDRLKAINTGWANSVRLQGAAANRAKSGGVFTPGDLLTAAKRADRSVRKGSFARGDALLQDFGHAAQQVMGDEVPDSGTAYRTAQLARMGAAGGVGAMVGHIPGALAGAAIEPATNALAKLYATNETADLGKAMLQRGSPLTGRNYLSQITRQSSALAPPRPMLALPAAAIASQAGSQ